jgi:hypothetical protein
MPAVSKDQRVAAAIAEHEPAKLYKRNRGLLGMSKSSLRDFAKTRNQGLAKKVPR